MSAVDVTLVLACYDEGGHFDHSLAELVEVLAGTRLSHEIVFVDDCSRDRTRELIDAAVRRYAGTSMRRIFHERNLGRGRAVADGFRAAAGEIVGTIDIDLETPAVYIVPCIAAIRDGADAATGRRTYRSGWRSLHRDLMSRGYAVLVQALLRIDLKDTETGCKFFRRAAALPLLDAVADQRWFWDTEIMARARLRGDRIIEIPVLHERRAEKASTVRPVSDSLDHLAKLWRFRKVAAQLRRHAGRIAAGG